MSQLGSLGLRVVLLDVGILDESERRQRDLIVEILITVSAARRRLDIFATNLEDLSLHSIDLGVLDVGFSTHFDFVVLVELVRIEEDQRERQDIWRVARGEESWILGMIVSSKRLHHAVDLLSFRWERRVEEERSEGDIER